MGVICVGECEGGGGEVAEEALLDLGVGLERAAVVEVIVVEAGEDAAVEVDAAIRFWSIACEVTSMKQ